MRTPTMLALLVLLTSGPSVQVQAQGVVYDNGGYTGATDARNISDFAIADDFVVASSLTFDALRFWAVDFTPQPFAGFSGTLSWFIYEGEVGATPNAIPTATIVASGTVSGGQIVVTETGDLLNGTASLQIVQVDVTIPEVTLATNRYWLRLKENGPADPFDGFSVLWMETGGPITGNGYRADASETNPVTWNFSGTATTTDLAFQLRHSAVPEPATLLLSAVGLGGVVLAGWKKRRKNK